MGGSGDHPPAMTSLSLTTTEFTLVVGAGSLFAGLLGSLTGGTPGGPGNSSRVLYMYIFQQAFEFNALGYASALAVALILLLVVVAAFQLRLLRAGESDLA